MAWVLRSYGMFSHDPEANSTWFSQSVIESEELKRLHFR